MKPLKKNIAAATFLTAVMSSTALPHELTDGVINYPPIVPKDKQTVERGQTLNFNVLAYDGEGDALEVTDFSYGKLKGTASFTPGTLSVSYTPPPKEDPESGVEDVTSEIIYATVEDEHDAKTIGYVQIDITEPPAVASRPPVVNKWNKDVSMNTPITFSAEGLCTDPDGDEVTITSAWHKNLKGSLDFDKDKNELTFTPPTDYLGASSSLIYCEDPSKLVGVNGINFTISEPIVIEPPVEDPPTDNRPPSMAKKTSKKTREASITFNIQASDLDGDKIELTYFGQGKPKGKAETLDKDTLLVKYTFPENINYEMLFVTVKDERGAKTTGSIEMIRTANQPPVLVPQNIETQTNKPVTMFPLDGATDDAGPVSLDVCIPTSGDIIYNNDGSVTITPEADFNGNIDIPCTGVDPDGDYSNPAVTTLSVVPPVEHDVRFADYTLSDEELDDTIIFADGWYGDGVFTPLETSIKVMTSLGIPENATGVKVYQGTATAVFLENEANWKPAVDSFAETKAQTITVPGSLSTTTRAGLDARSGDYITFWSRTLATADAHVGMVVIVQTPDGDIPIGAFVHDGTFDGRNFEIDDNIARYLKNNYPDAQQELVNRYKGTATILKTAAQCSTDHPDTDSLEHLRCLELGI